MDDPDRAVESADRLVAQVMSTRGYPIEDFETRAADLSVDHPRVVENYRVARALALRRANTVKLEPKSFARPSSTTVRCSRISSKRGPDPHRSEQQHSRRRAS